MKKRAPIIPARFRQKCLRVKLPATRVARFALESIAGSPGLFAEIVRELKKEVASEKQR